MTNLIVKRRLYVDHFRDDTYIRDTATGTVVGKVEVEVINDSVVITVMREDEEKFGPVSLVVV